MIEKTPAYLNSLERLSIRMSKNVITQVVRRLRKSAKELRRDAAALEYRASMLVDRLPSDK